MKLEENMYVRKKNGRIGRIREIDERDNVQLWYLLDIKNSNFDVKCEEKHIKKASHNIIDLIEVGDYVNGKLVSSLPLFENKFIFGDPVDGVKFVKGIVGTAIEDNKDNFIKSIVTKEQFEQMQYKVGE